MRKRVLTGTPIPKALACGVLEDGGRVLFLLKRDRNGIERIGLPCALVPSGRSPHADIKSEFERQTGIECQVLEVIFQGRYNAGSRKRRSWIPALGFKIVARNMRAKPAPEFSGFRWLKIDDALGMRLERESEWLKRREKERGEEEGKRDQSGPQEHA